MRRLVSLLAALVCGAPLLLAGDATTQAAMDRHAIESILQNTGILQHDVLLLVVPRDDLHLMIDGMSVPTEAGIESRLWFYPCACGRTRLVGELMVCDYEADDAVAALHETPHDTTGEYADLRVDALSPVFSGEKPSLRLIRLHGEGTSEGLAHRLRAALDCMGAARNQKSTTMPAVIEHRDQIDQRDQKEKS